MRKYYIKKFCGFIYAGYTEQKGDDIYGDYKIVSSKKNGEDVLKEYGWGNNQIYITNI